MAVIEEESSGEEASKAQPSAAAPSGYSSDGYETASDSELNDAAPVPEAHPRFNDENGKSFSSAANGGVSGEVKEEERLEETVAVEKEDAEVMI